VIEPADGTAWSAIADAEDARAATSQQLATIHAGTRSGSADIRRLSVRALGRLQRADQVDSIARALADRSSAVRAEAAHALALAVIADRNPARVRATVRAAIAREKSSDVVAALAETLGRLRDVNADSAAIVATELAELTERDPAIRLGAVRGLYFVVRQPAAVRRGIETARAALVRVATGGGSEASAPPGIREVERHARRLATETLALAGLADEATALQILRDPDPIVRREAVLIAGPQMADTAAAHRIVDAALTDPFWLARFEAMRQMHLRLARTVPCANLESFLRDNSTHVRLEAIDVMGSRCIADARTSATLDSIARTLRASTTAWHEPAHAVSALAKRDPARARAILPAFETHPDLFVRTYADTVAFIVRDAAALRRLANDRAPNVRAGAVHGLRMLVHHDADSVYLAQLASDDGQLLMEAAAALDSSTTPGVASLILDALDRVTIPKRENSRDGRMALLNTLAHIGTASDAPRVARYLSDFDPQVAARAAALLEAWGVAAVAAAKPLPREPMPTYGEARMLQRATVHVVMQSGATFDVAMLPFDAPTNAARFARLARTGYFNGLTLHRVEPNFVVQGGSPNANEYAGAPRFSRDEVGYPNNRGTVGLSTRGHDTGDAQLFINIIDNTQLDPLYTVFAVVVNGMDAVDRILEGDAIRSITIR
jgi:cyclophilin family peptidyl-prolyl cis-trans isomerase/HEAT repeat protein